METPATDANTPPQDCSPSRAPTAFVVFETRPGLKICLTSDLRQLEIAVSVLSFVPLLNILIYGIAPVL